MIRHAADVLRATLLLGAVVMSAAGEFDASVRLFGTFSALVVVRLIDPPSPFDLLFAVGMSFQGWGNALELFDQWDWYNKVVHYFLPLGLAPILYIILARLEVVHDLNERCKQHHAIGIAVVATALASTVGAMYEVWELFIHHALDAPIEVGYVDTVTDLLDNTLGALTGGVLLAWWGIRGGGTSRRDDHDGSPVVDGLPQVDRVGQDPQPLGAGGEAPGLDAVGPRNGDPVLK